MSAFEDRLWKLLADEHRGDEVTSKRATAVAGWRARVVRARPRPLALTAGALAVMAAAVAAIAMVFSATASTPPAYALTQNPNGSITVTINDLQRAIPQLNARFVAMGVDETVIPITRSCPAHLSVPVYPRAAVNDKLTFTVNEGHKHLSPGFDGVLAAGYTSSGQLLVFIGAMKPPLPTCFPPHPGYVRPAPGS